MKKALDYTVLKEQYDRLDKYNTVNEFIMAKINLFSYLLMKKVNEKFPYVEENNKALVVDIRNCLLENINNTNPEIKNFYKSLLQIGRHDGCGYYDGVVIDINTSCGLSCINWDDIQDSIDVICSFTDGFGNIYSSFDIIIYLDSWDPCDYTTAKDELKRPTNEYGNIYYTKDDHLETEFSMYITENKRNCIWTFTTVDYVDSVKELDNILKETEGIRDATINKYRN
ncbi:MAG TPA: hypothetical protein DCW90_11295 [Lachnospiraceae bacterium]|nr:hypothetical protein [Lachnospiraceae bacterium]